MAKKTIIEDVELGNSGEVSKDKINNNFDKVGVSLDILDGETVKTRDITTRLGFSQTKVPSEYAVSQESKKIQDELLSTKKELEEKIAKEKSNNKGIFDTVASLRKTFPPNSNLSDWFAFVGKANPREKYLVKVDAGDWIATGEKLDVADVNLEEYAEKRLEDGKIVVYNETGEINYNEIDGVKKGIDPRDENLYPVSGWNLSHIVNIVNNNIVEQSHTLCDCTSDFISINGGKKYAYKWNDDNSSLQNLTLAILWCDGNKKPISIVEAGTKDGKLIVNTSPANARYAKLNRLKTATNSLFYVLEGDVSESLYRVDFEGYSAMDFATVPNGENLYNGNYETNKLISDKGVVSTYNGVDITEPINVENLSKIIIFNAGKPYHESFYFYNSNILNASTFIEGYRIKDAKLITESITIDVPVGAKYVVGYVKTTVAPAKDNYSSTLSVSDGNNLMKGKYPKIIIGDNVADFEKIFEDFEASVDNPLANRTYSILGDSISSYEGIIPNGHPFAYPGFGVTDWKQTWWGLLQEKYKMKFLSNASWSGGKITGTTNGSLPNYVDLLGNNPYYIFVFAGINDYGSAGWGGGQPVIPIGELDFNNPYNRGEYAQALCYLFESLRVKYPLSNIVFITTAQQNFAPYSNGKFPTKVKGRDDQPFQYEYNDMAKEVCKIFGVQVIDLYNSSINFYNVASYTGDKLHPNVEGMSIIADYVAKHLK